MGQGLEDCEEALRQQGGALAQHREQGLPGDGVTAAGLVQRVEVRRITEWRLAIMLSADPKGACT